MNIIKLSLPVFVSRKRILINNKEKLGTDLVSESMDPEIKIFHLYPMLEDTPSEWNRLYIAELKDGRYRVIIGNHEITTTEISVAEKHLYYRLYIPLHEG